VADSVELSEELRAGRRALEDLAGEVTTYDDWRPAEAGRGEWWQLGLELHPRGVLATNLIPAKTRWIVLAESRYPAGGIHIHPAADGGITATFAHQRPNRRIEGAWRSGNICTGESVSGQPLSVARFEPRTTEKRLHWHVSRALEWVRKAATGALLEPGDPFELPIYADPDHDAPLIAFSEHARDLERWHSAAGRAGTVDLAIVRADGPYLAARTFRRIGGAVVSTARWGSSIGETADSETAIWIRLDGYPYMTPWEPPHTWAELANCVRAQGLDWFGLLRSSAESIRDRRSHYVLIGFPIPERFGAADALMHWIAAELPVLNSARAKTPVPGFRTDKARWMEDRRGGLADDAQITWVNTRNWHPEHLGSRGQYKGAFGSAPVAIMGAGALGSAVASMLVRGGSPGLDLFDRGVLEAGNLVRHELTLDDLGDEKAASLAARLNRSVPGARVRAHGVFLPHLDSAARAALDTCPLVIDTTGDDDVIDALGALSWDANKRFASVALSYGARRLYLFVASGERFPAAEFRRQFEPWLAAERVDVDEMTWEAPGCWNSVFPARFDDVTALAAVACRNLDVLMARPNLEAELRVFERHDDGTITRALVTT
jgi:ThiF family